MVGRSKVSEIMWMGRARKALVAFGLLVVMVGMVFALLLFLAPKPAKAQTIDIVTFTVNKTGDAQDRNIGDGKCDTSRKRGKQCTLRAAIQEANTNNTSRPDTINFNIRSRASVKTISPASELPTITEAVTIDGYSQPGAKENALAQGNDAVLKVELNGTNAGAGADGLTIGASDSTIKGLVINRFGGNGVDIFASSGNKVEGNFIGTNAAGNTDLGNGISGVDVSLDDGNTIGNTIGGTTSGARNIISGNGGNGVDIGTSRNNKVEGNYIGTDKNGTDDLGNDNDGVEVVSAPNNIIGGTAAGARNVISGNEDDGVEIRGSGAISAATGNEVLGNFIGISADGTDDLGNDRNGVVIIADDNTIGGITSGARNIIFGNGADGVAILGDGFGSTPRGNSVLSNQIFGNSGLGIDLGPNGVTANDVDPTGPNDDADTGPNNLQNFPVITSAIRSNTTAVTTISGTLNSTPNQTFTIQCFQTDTTSATSHGEGFIGLDTESATTNANGDANFTCTTTILAPGQTVSATATNTSSGDTSEFSQNFTVTSGP